MQAFLFRWNMLWLISMPLNVLPEQSLRREHRPAWGALQPGRLVAPGRDVPYLAAAVCESPVTRLFPQLVVEGLHVAPKFGPT